MRKDDKRLVQAAALWGEGRLQEALAAYETVLQDRAVPAMARAVLCEYLGRLHTSRDDLQTAESYLRRAVALNPAGVDHFVQLANCLCLRDRGEEAWELMQELDKRHRLHPQVVHYLGKLLDDRGQHEQGLVMMKKAVHLDPNNERLLADLAFSYLMHGEAGAAMVCSEQAMALNANDEIVRLVHDLASEFEKSSRVRAVPAKNRSPRKSANKKADSGSAKREGR